MNRREKYLPFAEIVEEIEDYAIITLNTEGIIENWNKGAEKIKGYKAEEIIGKSFKLFYTEEDLKNNKPEELIRRAAAEGKAYDEGWRLRKDREAFWGSILISSIHDQEDNIIGFAIVSRDLTERKQIQEKLVRYSILESKSKEMEEFTYIASHDLREPLLTIRNYLDIFTEDFGEKLGPDARFYIRSISKAACRMEELISGLLDYSRLSRPKEIQEVDCNQVMKAVLEDLHASVIANNVEVIVEQLPVLKGFPLELKLLFQNLVCNAVKFRRKDVLPKLRVLAKEINGYWQFEFSDNGIGIQEKDKQRIFLIFNRLHDRSEYEGTGIGLAHCKKIVELHHGTIWVESKYGEGSAFYFNLVG
jgi:PAS domain S-box-containing protein